MAEGPERGLELIDRIDGLDGYRHLHSARADLLRRLGPSGRGGVGLPAGARARRAARGARLPRTPARRGYAGRVSVEPKLYGCRSMTGRLERVLVRAPGSPDGWEACGWRGAPDPGAIAREHEALCSILERVGRRGRAGGVARREPRRDLHLRRRVGLGRRRNPAQPGQGASAQRAGGAGRRPRARGRPDHRPSHRRRARRRRRPDPARRRDAPRRTRLPDELRRNPGARAPPAGSRGARVRPPALARPRRGDAPALAAEPARARSRRRVSRH